MDLLRELAVALGGANLEEDATENAHRNGDGEPAHRRGELDEARAEKPLVTEDASENGRGYREQ